MLHLKLTPNLRCNGDSYLHIVMATELDLISQIGLIIFLRKWHTVGGVDALLEGFPSCQGHAYDMCAIL